MIQYTSLKELADEADRKGCTISEIVLNEQCISLNSDVQKIYEKMKNHLDIMRESVEKGIASSQCSNSGLSGGDAQKLYGILQEGKSVTGSLMCKAICTAIAVAEVNACMGKIVAAPTAGSCGILPSVLLTLGEQHAIDERKLVMSLFTAAGIGMVIAKCASISGSQGGCQAECGSASAMAAAAAVEMLGGSPQMCLSAAAFALQNMLGLICDPVGGLVEIPCIKRNVVGAVNAMAAAEMALAGLPCIIPADEVVSAMKEVGDAMHIKLKETALGGLAATKTARTLFTQNDT
jgi:L-serine dehydratase